jgi:hypothetical protein
MTPVLLVGTVTVFALAGYGVLRWRPAPEELHHVFRCPRCGQQLRYPRSAAGRVGMCPGCGRRCTMPSGPSALLPVARKHKTSPPALV